VHGLLSVLCDGVAYLGPDASILRPAPDLAHLLCVGTVAAAPVAEVGDFASDVNYLAGDSLLKYIQTEDHQRFLEFIASIQQADKVKQWVALGEILETNMSWAGRPPGAIHLHMSSSRRPAFPVDVFAVHFPDVTNQASHLIGVRDASSHGNVPELILPALGQASNEIDTLARRPRARSGRCPSQRSPKELTSTSAVELPELAQVALDINAATTDLEVRACTLRFASAKDTIDDANVAAMQRHRGQSAAAREVADIGAGRRRCLRLADLICSPNPAELCSWVQREANSQAAGNAPGLKAGLQLLPCPTFFSSILLEAGRASLHFIESSDSSDEESAAENDEAPVQRDQQRQQQQQMPLRMIVQLDSLVRQRLQLGRHGSSAGSNSSRRSRSSRSSSLDSRGSRAMCGPSLPAIEEHTDGERDNLERQAMPVGHHVQHQLVVADRVAGATRRPLSSVIHL